jgi:hypothetical protein
MTHQAPCEREHSGEPSILESRLRSLRERSGAEARRSNSKRKVLLAAGLALNAVCIVCLARVTSLFFALDAQALTQIGRLEVEKRLPDSRAAAAAHLKEMAPGFVRSLLEATLDLLPAARQRVVADLEQRLDAVTSAHEAALTQHLNEAVSRTRADLDTKMPEATDAEKLEALVAHVCAEFEKAVGAGINELYPEYSREMDRLTQYLTSLNATEDAKLSPKERLHKELIQTFLRLMVAERTREF